MKLGKLIEALREIDQNKVVRKGFCGAHSYRGCYSDLAFTPRNDVKIADMVDCAILAIGSTYEAYKGGEYQMGLDTECWLSSDMEAVPNPISDADVAYWGQEESDAVESIVDKMIESLNLDNPIVDLKNEFDIERQIKSILTLKRGLSDLQKVVDYVNLKIFEDSTELKKTIASIEATMKDQLLALRA